MKKLSIYLLAILISFVFLQCCDDDPEKKDDVPDDTEITCDLTYEQTLGNSWHFVGQSQYVNTYRGLYWVGETKTICSVDMNLNYAGDISAINYNVTVWEVDIDNNLELTTLLATSEAQSGSIVESGGSWVSFEFPEPVLVTSGKAAILISRVDKENYSVTDMLRISNNYDMDDEQNDQFNVHSTGTTLAGRSAGDEDQPEPFAFDVKLYGENTTVDPSNEYPAAPMNLEASVVSSSQIDLSWDDFNVAITADHYNIYSYNISGGEMTFVAESSGESYSVTGLTSDTEYNFVITSVAANGNESYHTDIASAITQ